MSTEQSEPDLFEDQTGLPDGIRQLVSDYSEILETGDIDGYQACHDFLKEAQELGYTFEYGLDGVPYGLRLASDDELQKPGPSLG